MTSIKSPAVSLGDVSLTLENWLISLRKRGRLQALLWEAVTEVFLRSRAIEVGLFVSAENLQQAADELRRRHGLTSAEQCHAWLAGQARSLLDFEDALENDLLIEKLKDHLTGGLIVPYFAANQAGHAQARLRLILVSREDEALELLSQFRDEGQDFTELAGKHSLHPSRSLGGLLGQVRRRELQSATADAVFTAREGDVVGPFAGQEGFSLLLVEALSPAELDGPTTALIRQELFDGWLADTLRTAPTAWPVLGLISESEEHTG